MSGASPQSTSALETVRRICDEDLRDHVDLEVVDIREAGTQAVDDGVVVVPTLVRRMPEPRRTLVGDLSDLVRVRTALDLQAPSRPGIEGEQP